MWTPPKKRRRVGAKVNGKRGRVDGTRAVPGRPAGRTIKVDGKLSRRLIALVRLLGDQGVHVSSMCEVLGVDNLILDPLLMQLVKSGRLQRIPPQGAIRPGGVYKVAVSGELNRVD